MDKEINDIYDDYLVKKNPVYPTSLEVLKAEEDAVLTEKEAEARKRELALREWREAEAKKKE